nr:hypothetical protein [Variovorax boronicumulans]
MAAGVQTFDAQGVLQLDTSSFVGRFVAIVTIPGTETGSINVPGLAGGIGFAVPFPVNAQAAGQHFATAPQCGFTGNTLSWYRPINPSWPALQPMRLLVGVR